MQDKIEDIVKDCIENKILPLVEFDDEFLLK